MASSPGFWRRAAPYAARDWMAAGLLSAACGCAAPAVQASRGAAPADVASPGGAATKRVRLEEVVVRRLGGEVVPAERVLGAGESLHTNQAWSVRLVSDRPMYFYVVLQRADKRHALLYPQPEARTGPLPAGPLRLPGSGDWFSLLGTAVVPGDRLCVIASEQPTGQLSCAEAARPDGGSRGEDQPPPPPPPPSKRAERPPPPPPDDKDDARGGRTVLMLPLAAG